ncbi:MAG: radical SAM protein [Candidatus Pacearchaeota archaeon]
MVKTERTTSLAPKENNRILFIHPPQSKSRDGNREGLNVKIPLGFLYMAGSLEKEGFEVKILDCLLYYKQKRIIDNTTVKIGLFPDQIIEVIKEFNPGIVGVSCAYSPYESDSFEIIDLVRKNFKDILIVVGGAHSSANSEHVLRNKNIDLVVIGEGELTIVEIAQNFISGKSLKRITGTAIRDKGKIIINKPREYIKDLDLLRPAWHLINLNKYFEHPNNSLATMRKNSIDIITSRGCPGNCVFCSIHTVWGRGWRARSPKNIVDEIEFLSKTYNSKQFRIQDDNLTLNKNRTIEICNEIIKRNLDVKWDTPNGIAIWTLDEELLLKMKQAGCYRVTFGIESGSPSTQKYIGKIIDLKKLDRLVNFCNKIGLWVCGTFIIGFPNETIEDIKKTENYIISSKINFPFIYIAQPYQGTRMYEDFKKHHLIKDFRCRSNVSETKYNTTKFTSQELNNLLKNINRKFYIKKILSYTNPLIFYSEFLSKIKSYEDLKYVKKMVVAILFKSRKLS